MITVMYLSDTYLQNCSNENRFKRHIKRNFEHPSNSKYAYSYCVQDLETMRDVEQGFVTEDELDDSTITMCTKVNKPTMFYAGEWKISG